MRIIKIKRTSMRVRSCRVRVNSDRCWRTMRTRTRAAAFQPLRGCCCFSCCWCCFSCCCCCLDLLWREFESVIKKTIFTNGNLSIKFDHTNFTTNYFLKLAFVNLENHSWVLKKYLWTINYTKFMISLRTCWNTLI